MPPCSGPDEIISFCSCTSAHPCSGNTAACLRHGGVPRLHALGWQDWRRGGDAPPPAGRGLLWREHEKGDLEGDLAGCGGIRAVRLHTSHLKISAMPSFGPALYMSQESVQATLSTPPSPIHNSTARSHHIPGYLHCPPSDQLCTRVKRACKPVLNPNPPFHTSAAQFPWTYVHIRSLHASDCSTGLCSGGTRIRSVPAPSLAFPNRPPPSPVPLRRVQTLHGAVT